MKTRIGSPMRGWLCASAACLALTACAVDNPMPPRPAPPPHSRPSPPAPTDARPAIAPVPSSSRPPAGMVEGVVAQNERFVLYRPKKDDTFALLARTFLGDERRGWEIADFNGIGELTVGSIVAIPLRPINPGGISEAGYQTIPILAYHRFGDKDGKMVVEPEAFAAQMKFLADNDYRVIRLADVAEFLAGTRALPRRAVVITADDGYASFYRHAFPVLVQHGFPATVFVYTDFIGAKDALTWPQMQEMTASGLIDIESHSKSHESMVATSSGESERTYLSRVDKELTAGRDLLQRKLGISVTYFAYPYGDANAAVVEQAKKADYRLAVTVNPGGNPFFAQPLLLRRTMIFGDHDIEAFKARLQIFRENDSK